MVYLHWHGPLRHPPAPRRRITKNKVWRCSSGLDFCFAGGHGSSGGSAPAPPVAPLPPATGPPHGGHSAQPGRGKYWLRRSSARSRTVSLKPPPKQKHRTSDPHSPCPVSCFKVFEEGSRGGTFFRKSLPPRLPRASPAHPRGFFCKYLYLSRKCATIFPYKRE